MRGKGKNGYSVGHTTFRYRSYLKRKLSIKHGRIIPSRWQLLSFSLLTRIVCLWGAQLLGNLIINEKDVFCVCVYNIYVIYSRISKSSINIIVFLIVLEAGKSKIKVPADSVSGGTHLLLHRHPSSFCVCRKLSYKTFIGARIPFLSALSPLTDSPPKRPAS